MKLGFPGFFVPANLHNGFGSEESSGLFSIMEGNEIELRDLLNAVNEKKTERDRKICQALAEFVKTQDGRKSVFDVVRAFSIFLERSRIEYDTAI